MRARGRRQGIVHVWMACSFEVINEAGRLMMTVQFSGIVIKADEGCIFL